MHASSSKKVLFISHEASRSGAPIVLLHLLRWLKKNTALRFDILLLSDGPLKADFEQLGKVFILADLVGQHSYPARIKKKLLGTTLNDQYRKAAVYLSKGKYDLVYGNTIVSLPWLKIFKEDHSIKTLCCVHELSYALNCFFTDSYLEKNLNEVDSIIAVSGAVKKHLITSYNLPVEKVEQHFEFIDTDILPQPNDGVKTAMGIKPDEFIIGAGGSPSWRKGTDLLIPLTLKLNELYPGFKFRVAWLGADTGNEFIKQLWYDAVKLGINDKLLFIPGKADPVNYINLFDVFVLLSREDPFPLIVLEAAFLKKPIIAFENGGGIPEFVMQGAGLLAPYLNTTKVAELVYQLSQDNDLATKMGLKGNELIATQHSTETVAPGIYNQISNLINSDLANN